MLCSVTEPRAGARPARGAVRGALFLLGIGLAVHLLLPQLGGLSRTRDAVADASLPWLLVAAAAFLASVLAGGGALLGATSVSLGLRRGAELSFAATALGHVSPGGVAGLRLLQRDLEHAGAERDDALGAVALVQVADVVVTVVALVIAAVAVGTTDLDPVHLPAGWVLVLAVVAVLAGSGLLLRSRLGHQHLVVPARTAARSALEVLGHPGQAGLLVGGTAAQTVALALGLAASLEAFHADAPLAHVVAIYLAATVVGTIS